MKYLYNAALPEAAQSNERDRLGQQLAEAGILGEDGASVESVASEAADLRLEGQFRVGEEFSSLMASELDELADSSLAELPLFRRGGGFPNAGYYEIASADVEPLHSNRRDAWSWTLDLTFVGKRATHFRGLETNPRQVDHEFGNDLEALVAVPGSARKVRWMHPDDKSTEVAEPVETRPAFGIDIEIYDLGDASWYDPPPFDEDPPRIIYEVGYEDEIRAGCRIYDTRGCDEKFRGGIVRQWQTVHTTEHDIDDPIVMTNGIIRLWLDESAGTLEVQEWDPDGEVMDSGTYGEGVYGEGIYYGVEDGVWVDVDLEQPEDVELYDVDVTDLGMVRDRAQLTFDVAGDLFALNAIVASGQDRVQFGLPENQPGPIPAALESWLEPIAATTIVDPQAAKSLVSRNDVRR